MAWTFCKRPDGTKVLLNVEQMVRIYPSEGGQPGANNVIDGADGKTQAVQETMEELYKKVT